ncbi:MAG: RHS repeat domain-containing protein, partial [Candidatus Methanofastidiosia archaeon]
GTWAYTYDDNGNLIQKADGYNTFIYTYDYENRMTEVKWNGVTLQENFYDCCGKRIKMKNYNQNGELTYTVIYIYIGWNTIYEKTIYPDLTETETKYIYGASGHIAKITDTGTIETTTFYHTDILGSVRQKTDVNGNSLWASYAIYKPFGGIYSGGPTDDSETHLYTGKTYDYGTGLYYYGARFYDPEVGRFVTKDLVQGFLVLPQTFNPYTYGFNNPLRGSDPDGLFPWVAIIAFLLFLAAIFAAYFEGQRLKGEYDKQMWEFIYDWGYGQFFTDPNKPVTYKDTIRAIIGTINNMLESLFGGNEKLSLKEIQEALAWLMEKEKESMSEEEYRELQEEVWKLELEWNEKGEFVDLDGDGWIGPENEIGSIFISSDQYGMPVYWMLTDEGWELVGGCPTGDCEPPP